MPATLWIGTRKGAFALRCDARRRTWQLKGPQFLGHVIHHIVQDPRAPKVLLMAAKTGHLGPTVFRSTDRGKTWKEAAQPPAFRKAAQAGRARTVDHVFWLTPGHASQPGIWYAGTSPQGLFRSDDEGGTWEGVLGLNEHPDFDKWTGGEKDGTPDGPKLHSVIVDRRDAAHLYVGMSSGGCFESRDTGQRWTPLNRGVAALFQPDPDPLYGHDPHCVVQHPAAPDRLYQQNHCGIYRLDRVTAGDDRWLRIGNNMPKAIGDIGFPIVVHPRDPDTAWVFPMDGTRVWPRTAINGKPAVYVTRNAGKSWQRLDRGLPRSQAWLTVLRQAMCTDDRPQIGLYFGTTGGEVWTSTNEGKSWRCAAAHLPEIYSVTYAV